MSAQLVDPFAPTIQPITQDEYDRIRDAGQEAVLSDRGYLPDAYQFLLRTLGTLAMTGYDPDGFAATQLRLLEARALDGVPMNDRQERL
jgi:hypothetical protein